MAVPPHSPPPSGSPHPAPHPPKAHRAQKKPPHASADSARCRRRRPFRRSPVHAVFRGGCRLADTLGRCRRARAAARDRGPVRLATRRPGRAPAFTDGRTPVRTRGGRSEPILRQADGSGPHGCSTDGSGPYEGSTDRSGPHGRSTDGPRRHDRSTVRSDAHRRSTVRSAARCTRSVRAEPPRAPVDEAGPTPRLVGE